MKLLITLIIIFNFASNYRRGRFLSSSTVWMLCYFMIFVLYPLTVDEHLYINASTIDLYAFIGILAFTVGGTIGRLKRSGIQRPSKSEVIAPNKSVAWVLFWIFLAASVALLISQIGVGGISQVLSGKMTSKQLTLRDGGIESSFTFAIHLLVPCVLALWVTANNEKDKRRALISLLIYIVMTLLFGFTRLFLISIIAMLVIFSLRHTSIHQQVVYTAFSIIALLFAMVILNFIRCFGLGEPISFKTIFDIDYIFESADFSSSYHWFNELLSTHIDLINPVVYLKPLFAFIPRAIWDFKPQPLSMQVLKQINPGLAATGYSTAGNSVLGEGYAVFGLVGIFLAPFIWGVVCTVLDESYYNRLEEGKDQSIWTIAYLIFAVFVVISGQRGDWSQYMTIVLWFYLLPLYCIGRRVPIEEQTVEPSELMEREQ